MNTQQDNLNSNVSNQFEQPLSVGKILREAREQMGLSVNDVANRIKFATRQIESLEADDYVRLPEAAFVRGFVRSYARLLELDPARLVAGLPSSHMQPASAHEVKSVEIPMPTAFSARRHNIIWLAAALVIALFLAIFERMHDKAPEKSVVERPVSQTTIQPLELPVEPVDKVTDELPGEEQPALPAQQPAAQVETVPAPVQTVPVQVVRPATVPVPAQAVRPQSLAAPVVPPAVKQPAPVAAPEVKQPAPQQTAVTPAVAAKPVAPPLQPVAPKTVRSTPLQLPWLPYQQEAVLSKPAATKPVPAETAATTPPAAAKPRLNAETSGSDHALRIEFDEDAWVDVKDASDKILVSRMHSAGSLVRVTGKAPIQVTIGNARAVRLFDNGKKINLERYTTADVARVKLK